MFKAYKEFALKGNFVDLAVGFIIGAAFSTVVSSLVEDILMPVLGLFTGGVDFTSQYFVLGAEDPGTLAEARELGLAAVAWGEFVNELIAFFIVSVALFFVVRGINKATERRDAEPDPEPAETPRDLVLLEDIRNLIAKQGMGR